MISKLYTAPAIEPVSLGDAKQHLRVTSTDEDTMIEGLIRAARLQAEQFTGRALITQVWDAYLDEWPEDGIIRLPYPPLQSVAGVYYTLDGAAEATFAADNYSVDTVSIMGRIVLKRDKSWPDGELALNNPIRIRFTAGYGTTGPSVPEPVKHAMKLIIGTLYGFRETIITGTIVSEMPMAVDSLLWPYRVKEF